MSDLIAMPIMQEYFASNQSEYDDFEEPVEILVKLAKEGEIDPWNIDIVEITDRFLQQIEKNGTYGLKNIRQNTSLCSHPASNEVQCPDRRACYRR